MGGDEVFLTALRRRPLRKWHPYNQDGGTYSGVQPENVPWQIYRACSDPDGNVNVSTYEMLHTRIDMGGLADILEMRDVHDSWAAAAMRNADSQAGR